MSPTGSALVAVDGDVCPVCSAPTATVTEAQPALIRHGGYGATAETSWRFCGAGCGWSLLASRNEVRP